MVSGRLSNIENLYLRLSLSESDGDGECATPSKEGFSINRTGDSEEWAQNMKDLDHTTLGKRTVSPLAQVHKKKVDSLSHPHCL